MPPATQAIIEDIVEQHFEEAAFLWAQRDAAVTAVNYSLRDLAYLDERLEAHIDGLRVAGDTGWAFCEGGLTEDEPGTLFTASVIAFESNDADRMKTVTGLAGQSESVFRGVVSGLGWMQPSRFKAIIARLVRNESPEVCGLGIAACGIRRVDPRSHLDNAIQRPEPLLKRRALKAAGQLMRADLLPLIQGELQNEDHACRFEAARAALLLGDHSALQTIGQFVHSNTQFSIPAMQVALRLTDTQTAQTWLKSIARDRLRLRDVIIGTGIAGDPLYIPMLLKQMEIPAAARAAGAAFSTITGVNLVEEQMEGEWPEGFEAGPTDDPEDEDVGMDPDEDLPWPVPELVRQWWAENQGAFTAGTRYLAGSPVSPEWCMQLLQSGMQNQRYAASLDASLAQADAPLFNIKAPGHWQLKTL